MIVEIPGNSGPAACTNKWIERKIKNYIIQSLSFMMINNVFRKSMMTRWSFWWNTIHPSHHHRVDTKNLFLIGNLASLFCNRTGRPVHMMKKIEKVNDPATLTNTPNSSDIKTVRYRPADTVWSEPKNLSNRSRNQRSLDDVINRETWRRNGSRWIVKIVKFHIACNVCNSCRYLWSTEIKLLQILLPFIRRSMWQWLYWDAALICAHEYIGQRTARLVNASRWMVMVCWAKN